MKNKKLLGVLSLLLASGLILGGCTGNKGGSTPSSNDSQKQVFTVTFVVEGQTVQTSQVEEGSLAVYEGETPTKATSAGAFRTLFQGWDKDITQPIVADTTFTAVFGDYQEEVVVDTFESYDSKEAMHDTGKWVPIAWSNETKDWEEDLGGSILLGSHATQGSKSLRFDAWVNGVGYKFAKKLTPAPADTKSVNAIQFSLMTSVMNTVKVILVTEDVEIDGKAVTPTFTYEMAPYNNEYVTYTLPLSGEWAAWGDAATYGTLAQAASWVGFHQDNILTKLKRIEFYLEGNDGKGSDYTSFFDNLKFVTIDNAKYGKEETWQRFSDVYTGKTADGHTVKLDMSSFPNVQATVLDTETPINIPGTIDADQATYAVTFTSADNGASLVYKAQMVDGGQRMKFVSATGTMAEDVKNMDLNAVQVLENFESYTDSGTAYYQSQTNKDARTGMRGAYYAEYYAGGTASSDYGKSGWSLMGGTGEQMNLVTSGGHNGAKYGSFKSSKDNAMRYMQWDVFDGTLSEKHAYRGSKFSFWAKSNGTTMFKVSVFSTPTPTIVKESNGVAVRTFSTTEVGAIGTWKHYEVDLNPDLVYYGFSFMLDHNYILDAALYIDDVEIYTANPYATYQAPAPAPVDKVPTGAYATKVSSADVILNVVNDSTAVLMAPALSLQKTATYTYSEKVATFTIEGGVTYTARLSDDKQTLQYVSVAGTDGQVKTALTNASFARPEFVENCEQYESDGVMYHKGTVDMRDNTKISGARGAYACDYYSASATYRSLTGEKDWSLMGGNGDQLQLDTSTAADGNKSIKIKFGGNNMRYYQWSQMQGTSKAHKGFSHFGLYIKNPNATALELKVRVYKEQRITVNNVNNDSKQVIYVASIPASSGWTFYSFDLDSATTYYGVGFTTVTKPSAMYINLDCAYFY